MNKKTIVVLIIVLVILLGGGAFYFLGKSHTGSSSSAQNASTQPKSTQITTQKKSLLDFLSMAGSTKCTFSDKTTNSSGTVYTSSGKMRGDFQSTSTSHMINDGSFVYMWTDGQKTGYKMSLAIVKKEAAQVSMAPGKNTPSQAVDMRQQADYSCGPWADDASVFTLPKGVTFTDYSAMMQGAAPSGTMMHQSKTPVQGSSAMCARCNQAPAGGAREQCLKVLKCQ